MPRLSQQYIDALVLLGFTEEGTGGNCTALIARYSDELVHVITDPTEPTAPLSLNDPVTIGTYTVASWDGGLNGDAEETRTYATLRACLVELFGNCEGETLPWCLQTPAQPAAIAAGFVRHDFGGNTVWFIRRDAGRVLAITARDDSFPPSTLEEESDMVTYDAFDLAMWESGAMDLNDVRVIFTHRGTCASCLQSAGIAL